MNLSSPLVWYRRLGPGLLFAGSAVGVSHIYQSTRAGAEYGTGLLLAVLLANLLKYPFFEFGPRYALASGESLLHGYRRQGYWVLLLFALLTLGTVFTIQAAITGVTVALLQHVLGLEAQSWLLSAALLLACAALLLGGRYRLLDRSMKYIIVLLSLATLLAAAAAFLQPAPEAVHTGISDISVRKVFSFSDPLAVIFLIGLMGWMPAPIDLSVWHSVWALEKRRLQPAFGLREALFDFRLGYAGTALLAVVFLLLGARMLYGSTPEFPATAGEFSALLIDLYRKSLGPWAGLAISIAALATMFSTTLTVLDAMPRVLRQTFLLLFERRQTQTPDVAAKPQQLAFAQEERAPWLYTLFLFVLIAAALLIIRYFSANLRSLVDLATLLSFLTAPFFALANYSLVTGRHMSADARPGAGLRALSIAGIVYLSGFTLYFLLTLIRTA